MTHYIIQTKVGKIEQRQLTVRVEKDGTQVVEPLGWFVMFDGSSEVICLGSEKPDLAIGQKVTIRIEPQ